ncbi:hypothetical protein GCM10027161_02210 [Microbispora hainanensis]
MEVEIATATPAAAEADTADNQAPSSLLPRKYSELSKGIKRISGQEAGTGASLNAPYAVPKCSLTRRFASLDRMLRALPANPQRLERSITGTPQFSHRECRNNLDPAGRNR